MEASPVRFILGVFSTRSFPLSITYPEPVPCMAFFRRYWLCFSFFVVYRYPVMLSMIVSVSWRRPVACASVFLRNLGVESGCGFLPYC